MPLSSVFSTHSQSDVEAFYVFDSLAGAEKVQLTRENILLFNRWQLKYAFEAHFHPLVSKLRSRIDRDDLYALMRADTDLEPVNYSSTELSAPADILEGALPEIGFDFRMGSAYGVYNWELFFHVPMLIALHLSRNQRFEEAREWFHLVFDPTSSGIKAVEGSARFWNFKPFQDSALTLAKDHVLNLVQGTSPSEQSAAAKTLGALKNSPFSPHLVARYRPSAYMAHTVMAYLDNLIAWGDSLFRQDTRETINEAMQVYVLAANLLGPRPQEVPTARTPARGHSYESLRAEAEAFAAGAAELEIDLPLDALSLPPPADIDDRARSVRGLARTFYFCVPANAKLLSYWDLVADRLFKIRNSLNLEGTFRKLPLFAPPIDPGLLAAATSSGLDVASVVRGLEQPLPLVRFQVLLQRAAELSQEVKSLGGLLLSAIEKKDNEALSLLRAGHEKTILERAETVRYQQHQEAIKQREALERSISAAARRLKHYRQLIGESELELAELSPLDQQALQSQFFSSDEPQLEFIDSSLGTEDVEFDSLVAADGTQARVKLTPREKRELWYLTASQVATQISSITRMQSSSFHFIPDFTVQSAPWGVGTSQEVGGGSKMAKVATAIADAAQATASFLSYQASSVAKESYYERRQQDWALAHNNTVGELNSLFKQLRAAQIRENIAKCEWDNHKQQIENARDVEDFLKNNSRKKTTEQFYVWMSREAKGMHARCFDLAYDAALKAERALQHELGDSKLRFLGTSYLQGNEGLLSGEKLYFDIKRMEMAYLDLNKREYEITKHVSLLQLDPMQLIELRATGTCTIDIPEEIFDIDGPGHYFRRIKTVSLSLPCVAGPHTSISCKLTQTKSSIRRKVLGGTSYARASEGDDRFSDANGSVQSIVTSTGVSDSGMFELTLRDERYLPFEGSGAISTWKLELPTDYRQFDYNTISDVIMHVRFTARDGGQDLQINSRTHLDGLIGEGKAAGTTRLFSVRHEFPSEWARLLDALASRTGSELVELRIELRDEHYPFWLKGVSGVGAAAAVAFASGTPRIAPTESGTAVDLDVALADGIKRTRVMKSIEPDVLLTLSDISSPVTGTTLSPRAPIKMFVDASDLQDLWLAITLA